jgi:hypothetical protein
MSLRRTLLPLAAGLIAFAVPSVASAANVTNAQFGFCQATCLSTTTTGKAGANAMYHFEFTVPSGFDGGAPSTGDGSQSFTIDGSGGKAPGTGFPTNPNNYQIGYGTGGYSVHPFRSGAIQVTNGGERLVVTPFNGSLNVGAGETMELDIYGNSARNGCTVGGGKLYSISTTLDGAANTNTFSLVAGDPATLSASGGDDQSTIVGNAFATALQAHLTDSCGNDVPSTNVSFTAPDSGASGSFAAGTSTTNASGIATAPTLTANTVAGDWQAGASVTGGSNPTTTFNLTNDPGAVNSVDLDLEPDSILADGFSTSIATLHIKDEYDNPISGIDPSLVTFSAQDTGQLIGTTSDAGNGNYSAQITASSTPGDSLITGVYDGTLQDTQTLTQTQDLIAPIATINIGPGGKTRDRTPTFYFSSDDEHAEFEGKVDSGRYRALQAPHTLSKLSYGKHKFSVRAVDSSDNKGPVDSLSFKVVK